MSVGEFNGIEFAAGSVVGARSFNIDDLGRLTGVNFPQVWRPGENEAKCLRDSAPHGMTAAGVYQAMGLIPPPWLSQAVQPVEPKPDLPHSMEKCSHGFYAFYDGSNDYREQANISGVIEGYGEVVIGTRGFRCMKAKILALHIGGDEKKAAQVSRNYSEIPQFNSFAEMVKAFPPDSVGAVGPENDPDFWDRQI